MNRTPHEAMLFKDILDFNEKYFPGWDSPKDVALTLVSLSNALAGEAGEVCNAVKHRIGGGTHKVHTTHDEILEELADVYIYLVLLVEYMDFDEHEFAWAVRNKILHNVRRMESADFNPV